MVWAGRREGGAQEGSWRRRGPAGKGREGERERRLPEGGCSPESQEGLSRGIVRGLEGKKGLDTEATMW